MNQRKYAVFAPEGAVFVFGSNLAGVHGAGAAAHAATYYGAIYGIGEGIMGNSYALPTKDRRIKTLPLACIEKNVERFIRYASNHPEKTFFVTAIGCGLAGFSPDEIGPMFAKAPKNCILSHRFKDVLEVA